MPHTEQWPIETAAEICPVFRHLTGAPAAPRDSIDTLARAVADHAINSRLCCTKYPPCQTEAWRVALATDIAALARAAHTASEHAADLAARALTKARAAIVHHDGAAPAPATRHTIRWIDEALAALAAPGELTHTADCAARDGRECDCF